MILIVVLIFISLIIGDVEHFSCDCWQSVWYVFFGDCLFKSLENVHFLIELFAFLILSYMGCLYIWGINPLSVASFSIVFPYSKSCLFILLMVFFTVQKVLSLIRS